MKTNEVPYGSGLIAIPIYKTIAEATKNHPAINTSLVYIGADRAMKGGIGSASLRVDGITVGALVAVNASVLARPLGGLELRFRGCTLNYMTLRDLELGGSVFEGCLLHEAVFSGTKLVKASFCGSDLLNSTFLECDLSEADFRGAQNYQISTKRNRVEGLKASFPEVVGLLADMKNAAGRYGGAITAAQFLQRFVGKTPWAHLDIAGMVWSDKAGATYDKGATGYGVKLLDRFVADNFEG